MQPDILIYHRFYAESLGEVAAKMIGDNLVSMWPNLAGRQVAAIGYGLPYLNRLEEQGATGFALMPGGLGVCPWPDDALNRSCLVMPDRLPFEDASLTHIVVVHALEHMDNPQNLLSEVWRVLVSSGEAIFIVPNRRRMWSALEVTPFGYGRPYSKRQLATMLKTNGFTSIDCLSALMLPPIVNRFGPLLLKAVEMPLYKIAPAMGGLLIARAGKQLYAPTGKMEKSRVPQPVAQPALASQSIK